MITPNFNGAKYLEATINSVISQGYPNLEYIIIDGGSTDGSVDIIRQYESQLAYWVSEKDQGQSEAINKGIQVATGEILAWLNSDDIYLPNALLHVAKMFQRHQNRPAFAGVYGLCKVINESGASWKDHGTLALRFSFSNLLVQNFIPQPSTFLKMQAVRELGGVNAHLHYSMDYDLFLRLSQKYRLVGIPKYYSGFRVVSGTKSTASPALFLEENKKIFESMGEKIPADLQDFLNGRYHWSMGLDCLENGRLEAAREHLQIAFRDHDYPRYDKETVFHYILYQNGRLRQPAEVASMIELLPNHRSITVEEANSRYAFFNTLHLTHPFKLIKNTAIFIKYPWWLFSTTFFQRLIQNSLRRVIRRMGEKNKS